jgi:hypothetical protein
MTAPAPAFSALALLLFALAAAGQTTRLPAIGASSSPSGFTASGEAVFFTATTTLAGRELWRTDGTAAGTQLAE